MHSKSSIDPDELNKFNKTEQEWWDLNGEFKFLHQINPIRKSYIKSIVDKHFDSSKDLKLLDVGCGGGLVSVQMEQLGFNVTAIDANSYNIEAAKSYADRNNLDINYINVTVEEHIGSEEKYDIIVCLEVIEHVANSKEFVDNISKLLKPGGVIIFSTINRTKKSYFLAIVMAEYVLGWIPRQTHDYSKFVKPSEFVHMLKNTNLSLKELKGLSLSPMSNKWRLSDDIDVNYFAVFS